mmetsp:Transcript_4404/g.9764  ORF Transcript_4404/g.9764 Transcript_4404/m.9764 type:complete len:567 (-) Transcript_4404:151-1851(-)|eukprot:CAMPEP_0183728074 /NCGR_PEP_ID=MMETSP0737-20130205/27136_1 /TAXON_ID=385413 /ORGANISM="Thalassiosira miniscula, Strain CCMP1093" /LENGTH=566 /DNA_ID=CAMNT_0025959909 /DNA_START=99 /DNA_END=1799 /DNA_ORIENTATION=+
MLLSLPEDCIQSIAFLLSPPDILTFLSVHRNLHEKLSKTSSFWARLLCRDRDEEYHLNSASKREDDDASIRQEFMIQAYKQYLPSIKWYPVTMQPNRQCLNIPEREGHVACVLKGPRNEKWMCITGGFSDDRRVFVLRVPSRSRRHLSNANSTEQPSTSDTSWRWTRLSPQHHASFVYGASLTALPSVMEDGVPVARALRFGGFESGGYSDETNEIWLLSVKEEQNEMMASWERIDDSVNHHRVMPRAYHSATLVADRYLVIIGGMIWRGSVLQEAILDTQTWTWMDGSISTGDSDDKPSGRHGHSVIFDNRRNRLVLFGGGSGTDLLRSGSDNAEVWQLKMNQGWKTSLQFPWEWSRVHGDDSNEHDDDDESANDASSDADMNSSAESSTEYNDRHHLSPAESLCLGRCHNGMKIAPDTALLCFGGGRPNTNGVLGYNLSEDKFLRPGVEGTFLPQPRFTGVATFLDEEGYIFAHGGFATEESEAIGEMDVLDLAPGLKRRFAGLPVDSTRPSYEAVTDQEAENMAPRPMGGFSLLNLLASRLSGLDDMQQFLLMEGSTLPGGGP